MTNFVFFCLAFPFLSVLIYYPIPIIFLDYYILPIALSALLSLVVLLPSPPFPFLPYPPFPFLPYPPFPFLPYPPFPFLPYPPFPFLPYPPFPFLPYPPFSFTLSFLPYPFSLLF
jgi:hypothetical protein